MLILTPREKQLLRRLAQGKPDDQIGKEIGGNRRQVALQRERLLAKLRLRSHDEICEAARQLASWPTKI
jgi:DNA-binding CsgD family transcriptional regulator